MSQITIAAIKYVHATMRVEAAKEGLDTAYSKWKQTNRMGFIERNSPEWLAMLKSTKPQYKELQAAKSQERRLRKKLVITAKEVCGHG